MLIYWWRFLSLLLTSLSLGMSFAHVLEMPVRLRWPATFWADVTTFHGLYDMFGRIGAVIDVSAIGACAILAVLVRARRPAFAFSLTAAIMLAIGLGLWFAQVSPMNAVMADWSTYVGAVAVDPVRQQWEFGHTTVAIAKLLAAAALFLSVLADTRQAPRA
ncbi:DUF1772 domain-containing protein [Emcibacter sp. SYSU 3D8]|uniref:DUF1772 domain-containing protein n=1 Tax=Emcibacter sp. SYSU 3D8 TaxID=3133969 RepID=UPI0031FF020D